MGRTLVQGRWCPRPVLIALPKTCPSRYKDKVGKAMHILTRRGRALCMRIPLLPRNLHPLQRPRGYSPLMLARYRGTWVGLALCPPKPASPG